MRKFSCFGVWIVLLAPLPLAAQGPQTPPAGDARGSLTDAKRADREKVERAEKQLNHEKFKAGIILSIAEMLKKEPSLDEAITGEVVNVIEGLLEWKGLPNRKQAERDIGIQADAGRTGKIIVEQERADDVLRAAEYQKQLQKLRDLLSRSPATHSAGPGTDMNPGLPSRPSENVNRTAPAQRLTPSFVPAPMYTPTPTPTTNATPTPASPRLAPQASPTQVPPLTNSSPSAPTFTKRFGYDDNAIKTTAAQDKAAAAAQPTSVVRREGYDNRQPRIPAPGGVTIGGGIDGATIQRATAPSSLLDTIRSGK